MSNWVPQYQALNVKTLKIQLHKFPVDKTLVVNMNQKIIFNCKSVPQNVFVCVKLNMTQFCFVCVPALQSPIEYQRRESKSNSLGRSMKPPLAAVAGLRPHSSASIDRHKLPSLRTCNTSLPSLYLPSQVPTDDHSQPEVREFNQGLLIFVHSFTLSIRPRLNSSLLPK